MTEKQFTAEAIATFYKSIFQEGLLFSGNENELGRRKNWDINYHGEPVFSCGAGRYFAKIGIYETTEVGTMAGPQEALIKLISLSGDINKFASILKKKRNDGLERDAKAAMLAQRIGGTSCGAHASLTSMPGLNNIKSTFHINGKTSLVITLRNISEQEMEELIMGFLPFLGSEGRSE